MSTDILIVAFLNFIISLIGTLVYSVRIVGVRTGKIAISSALFNALALVSRTANVFQLPLLTKHVEKSVKSNSLFYEFNFILLIILFATVVGAFLIPTFQRIFSKAVESFSMEKSIFRLIMHSFSKSGVVYLKSSIKIPARENVKSFSIKKMPVKILLFNMITMALLTVGVFAPIYAGSIQPDLRSTCITLSSVVNSIATILLTLFIDPYLSVLTDDVIEGKYKEADFRNCVIGLVGSKILGTALSFLLLIPAAYAIVFIARII